MGRDCSGRDTGRDRDRDQGRERRPAGRWTERQRKERRRPGDLRCQPKSEAEEELEATGVGRAWV